MFRAPPRGLQLGAADARPRGAGAPPEVPFNSSFRDQNFSFESFADFHTVNGLTGDSFKPATRQPVRRVGSTLLPSWGKNVNGLVNRQ